MKAVLSLNWFLSFLVSTLRLGAGTAGALRETEPRFYFYEFEGCPFCRIAREAISEAGIAVIVRPCPKGGKRFRPLVIAHGGKAQFPYLVSIENNQGMYESGDIAEHVLKLTGRGRPLIHWLGPIGFFSSQLGVLLRFFAGTSRTPSRENAVPLVLTGAERNPSVRLVKEKLCEYEIEYIWQPLPASGGVCLVEPGASESLNGPGAALRYLSRNFRSRSG